MDGDVCQGPCERTAAREAGARYVEAAMKETFALRAAIREHETTKRRDLTPEQIDPADETLWRAIASRR